MKPERRIGHHVVGKLSHCLHDFHVAFDHETAVAQPPQLNARVASIG